MTKPRRFFGLLCAHQWKVVEQYAVLRPRDNGVVGTIYVLQCEHCGKVTSEKV